MFNILYKELLFDYDLFEILNVAHFQQRNSFLKVPCFIYILCLCVVQITHSGLVQQLQKSSTRKMLNMCFRVIHKIL